jgi:chromosome segregation ATPase
MTEQNAATTHWPTYALRAWMTTLLGQMERARDELDNRIELQEKELTRLRAQKERSGTVITSLRESVGAVDNVLRRARDADEQSKGTLTEKQEAQRPKYKSKKEFSPVGEK